LARYTGPVCRLCRREGMKLFLKGDRCFTEKCAIEKRNYAPGQHGKGGRVKTKLQGYGLQLREKQKVKRLYRMQEGQFGLTFDRAAAEKGVVGEVLLSKL
jgi:small subunit ribosomal protein S4